MNIFVTDPDPQICARNLDDRRLRKMLVETAQILSTVLHDQGRPAPYRPTHGRHPCVRWAAAERPNFEWLILHGLNLGLEFKHRWPEGTHKTLEVMNIIHIAEPQVEPAYPEWFQNSARDLSKGLDFTDRGDVFTCYQQYLKYKWDVLDKTDPTWTRRGSPAWR